jgi:hypothetical protein
VEVEELPQPHEIHGSFIPDAPQQINFCLYTSDVAEYKGAFVLCDVTCIQNKNCFVVVMRTPFLTFGCNLFDVG